MSQDNRSASHKAGYTALLLDPKRGGLVGVTADHNLLLLEAESHGSGGGNPGKRGEGSLVARRQIVGYNDEIIDMKSLPNGVGDEGDSWVAVATNSPQVNTRANSSGVLLLYVGVVWGGGYARGG